MPLFLSISELTALHQVRKQDATLRSFYWALLNRAEKRAASPSLSNFETTTEWWHHASEYLSDAAMAFALKPSPALATWIRNVTLSIARRSVKDWSGPSFRSFSESDPVGNLETAHLSWGTAIVLDLASDVFTDAERGEVEEALRAKGLTLCQRWLDLNNHLANWRCIMTAGACVAAAVLDDKAQLERCAQEFRLCQHVFQNDGSHSESLQYGNYAAYAQMLTWEALVRHSPSLADKLPLEPYVLMPRWQAASFFYMKPLSGWGGRPIARAANFNDSAAIFRPSADLLLHISARAKESHPTEAGLARWIFDATYSPEVCHGPQDRASFGFVNDFGFLTLSMFAAAALPISPPDASLPETSSFSCGDVIARDCWNGKTILAARSAGDPLCGPGHLHGDINSFILAHNQERLLVDPGHSCYRNLIHELESASLTHNTCTFVVENEEGALQQSHWARRRFDPETREPHPPVPRGGQRLLAARLGSVTAIASEASSLYGAPMEEFTRVWILCGTHVVFIVDRIRSAKPVKTTWNWLLNNRDNQLDLKLVHPDRLVARRGNAGMKLFHLGGGRMGHPINAYVHDAYHPLPNQLGEGGIGTGSLVRWTETKAASDRTVVHAICVDDFGGVANWHLHTEKDVHVVSESQTGESWKLEFNGVSFIQVAEKTVSYQIGEQNGDWTLKG